MHEYDQRQMRRHHIIEQRKKEIYEVIPQYKEIENRIASESIKLGIASLSGNPLSSDAIDGLKETIEDLKRQKKLLLTSAGYSINYLDPNYECPYCKDTGFIGNEPCHCFKKAKIESIYKNTTAKMLNKDETFENISHEYQIGEDLRRFISAEKTCREFVDNFEFEYKNLLFKGNPGTGKTFLSNCIANALIQKGYTILYFSSESLFENISSYVFSKDKSLMNNPLNDIYSCDLLIIDDLGSEFTNQFVISELFSIINERHMMKKHTIISTNLETKDIPERYTERTFSRINAYYDAYDLEGEDIRKYKKRIEQRK